MDTKGSSMRQALTLHVEIFDKADGKESRSALWYILPEHVESNVKGAAVRCECMVKTYLTIDGANMPANRKPYFDYDGALVAKMLSNPDDRQAYIDYDGVRHGLDTAA